MHSATTLNVVGNDFSDVGAVATGMSNAEVDLRHNFWGTTNTELIDAKILQRPEARSAPLAPPART